MKMVFLMGPNRRLIPMSKVRTVYVVENDLLGEDDVQKLDEHRETYVSHFEVCPNADDFSGGRRG